MDQQDEVNSFNLMKVFQSSYGLKCITESLDCQSTYPCRIMDENRISLLLRTYLAKLQTEERCSELQIPCFPEFFQHSSNSLQASDNSLCCLDNVGRNHKSKKECLHPPSNLLIIKKEKKVIGGIQTISQSKSGSKCHYIRDSVSADRPHRCNICKMAFKRKLHLKRHFLVTHTEKKSHICKMCGKTFSRKDYLDKHTSGHLRRNYKLKLLEEGVVVRTKIRTLKK